jgi:tetratricopeptide (TPR) repeat protein
LNAAILGSQDGAVEGGEAESEHVGVAVTARIVREQFLPCEKAGAAVAADVRELRRAVASDPDRVRILANLAISLYSRYRCDSNKRDVNAAITHLRAVLRLLPPRHPDRPMVLGQLSMFLVGRREPGDLEDASRVARRALAATPRGKPGWAVNLAHVAEAELELFKDSNDKARLDSAIGMYAELTAERPLTSAGAIPFHINYAVARLTRFGTDWSRRDDLDAALSGLADLAGRDLSEAPPGAELVVKSHLIQALSGRYQLAGDRADLVKIDELREDLDTRPDRALAGRARALVYDNAATASLAGYLRTGDLSLLDRAIREQQEALACTPPGDPNRPGLLGNLGLCRLLRHRERRGYAAGDRDDQAEGMRLAREAVTESSAGGVYSAASAGILGTLVLEESMAAAAAGRPDLAGVDLAVDLLTMARDGMSPGDPQRAAAESKLSQGLGARSLLRGDTTGLRAAAADFRAAYAAMPPGSMVEPGMLGGLATLQLALAVSTRDPADAEQAVEAARQAVQAGSDRHPASAFETALEWGAAMWQLGHMAAAGEAYATALRIMHDLTRAQLTTPDKDASLGRARDVTARATVALALGGQPEQAALAAETGRAVALSEATGIEQARILDTADRDHPDLVLAYRQSATELRRRQRDPAATLTAGQVTAPWPRLDDQADARAARRALDASIGDLERALGVELLRPPTPKSLHDAVHTAGVPVVYLVASEIGGTAVVVEPGGRVYAVPLPVLTESLVAEITGLWLRAAGEEKEDFGSADRAAALMWTGVMEPVVRALDGWPQAALVPIGGLGIVPLHAASWQDDDGTRRYAADVISLGYAPNARILAVCGERAARLPARPVLLVADPRSDEAVDALPAAVDECETLGRLLPDGDVLARLYHGDATRPAVLYYLHRAAVMHFACHAVADRAQVLDSAVFLAGDGRLTVRDLLRQQLPSARLAVLSACSSALIGADLQDEVVSLPSALVQAGVAGVVGSLWAVDDIATAALLARFYELWLTGGTSAPAALAAAQRWLRSATNGEIQDRYPEIDQEPPAGGEGLRWREEREYESPLWWAPFIVMGT